MTSLSSNKVLAPKRIHILGICGTFMGSLALLARELGYEVSGCDDGVYPPMSDLLACRGIEVKSGYLPEHLYPPPDLVIVGNALSRGNPALEHVLDEGLTYTSGPEWLGRHLLVNRWVLAVSGTHGKTTTSAMLAWILEYAGLKPGFLIGGVTKNFSESARLGDSDFFVIEADEYDSAFFDKRSKFLHYRPRTLVINNIEFDHADIFDDIKAIQMQFSHLLRTVPSTGKVIFPAGWPSIETVIDKGCWSDQERFDVPECQQRSNVAAEVCFSANLRADDGSEFELLALDDQERFPVEWQHSGKHNVANALSAALAARHVGVPLSVSALALSSFKGVKRRLECIASTESLSIYDDFAHHPSAIQTTLEGLRKKYAQDAILAVIEPRSNTMKQGVHKQTLLQSAAAADQVIWVNTGNFQWLQDLLRNSTQSLAKDVGDAIQKTCELVRGHAEQSRCVRIVIMSNGGFGGIHRQLVARLCPGHASSSGEG